MNFEYRHYFLSISNYLGETSDDLREGTLMKTWAEKRKREVEALGGQELAGMFDLIIRLYELEEQVSSHTPNDLDAQLDQESEARHDGVTV